MRSPDSSESTHAQWQSILHAIATHDYGVVQTTLPMMHSLDGRTLRVNEPPAGITPRRAAVLIMATPAQQGVELIITRRSGSLRQHGGEIAFPGGRVDESDESVIACALREANEEIGISAAAIKILGTIHHVYVPRSNHIVTPVVAWVAQPPTYTTNPAEVDEVFHLPIDAILGSDALRIEERHIQGETIRVPYYPFQEHRIWGATALMLCDLSARIDRCITYRNSGHKESE